MKITAAITKEQGVTFTVILVKTGVISSSNREQVRTSAPSNFPRPIILAEQSHGKMKYHGRTDIVRFLSNVPYQASPWKDYTL
ncbi:hypothetical protein P7H48_13105 [Enterococcus lactis]|uniref:hypothetical protein n=1 Tax=Enterococcus lactis TaxID=357441 RepID=UPI0018690349|nr:hypothetical protein [Enterococcus lactis]MBE2902472.1 hypothetical protein [Enterococcus faecium]MDT2780104.1 hypothetical protein [Enterococcus lactis]